MSPPRGHARRPTRAPNGGAGCGADLGSEGRDRCCGPGQARVAARGLVTHPRGVAGLRDGAGAAGAAAAIVAAGLARAVRGAAGLRAVAHLIQVAVRLLAYFVYVGIHMLHVVERLGHVPVCPVRHSEFHLRVYLFAFAQVYVRRAFSTG